MNQMQKGQRVIIKKMAAKAEPHFPTATWDSFVPGRDNGDVSPPVEYEVEGVLTADIEVGKGIRMNRERRNDVYAFGEFSSSQIERIEGDRVFTLNSEYRVTPV